MLQCTWFWMPFFDASLLVALNMSHTSCLWALAWLSMGIQRHFLLHLLDIKVKETSPATTCVPAESCTLALLIHSHLVDFSAASLAAWMTLILAAPVAPRWPKGFTEWATCKASHWPLTFLSLVPSIRSSQGTVSSNMIRCFKALEVMIMSGWRVALAMCSCFLRSTCQLPIRACVVEACCLWTRPVFLHNHRGRMVFAGADSWGYALSNCFENLVMAPTIATVSQGLWAAAEEMLLRSLFWSKTNSLYQIILVYMNLLTLFLYFTAVSWFINKPPYFRDYSHRRDKGFVCRIGEILQNVWI